MSEEEARRTVAEASREAEQAAQQGEKARQEFEAIEQRQRAGLPPVPRGPPPEARKHVKIQPEKLERKPETGVGAFFRRRQSREAQVRERRVERTRTVRQAPHVSSSRGAPLYTKRNPLESSGRISTERTRTVRQAPHVSSSRGAPLYTKRNPLESSGRISTELNPVKQERLAKVREYIRAFQNRKELGQLEKVWRRTRARYSHDPELRP